MFSGISVFNGTDNTIPPDYLQRSLYSLMNERICPTCGHRNRPNARFCAACGGELVAIALETTDELPTVPSGASDTQQTGTHENEQTIPTQNRLHWRMGQRSDIGRLRETNEDSHLVLDFLCINKTFSRSVGFLAVADGMGGHEGGEIASGMLVRALARQAAHDWLPRAIDGDKTFDTATWLAGAIQTGNEEIYEWSHDAGLAMGTTIVAAVVMEDQVCIAHVGDSRAYRINDMGIERLTADHSLVESLVAANQISREEARAHPQANVIYRTVGDNPHVPVELSRITLAAGDFLLLCSDGLNGMVSDDTIRDIVKGAPSPQAACDLLIETANHAGGEDNTTVILVELKSI